MLEKLDEINWEFDEEGRKTLMLPGDGSPMRG
jgi:hypothetical protein